MENPTIGIKIADGTYIPILEKDDPKKKKLVLTTVRDEQTKVQIDLYRGEGMDMVNAQYIGTLLIDNIAPTPGGEAEIELQLGMDPDGNLQTRARDLHGEEEQSLALNLEDLPDNGAFEVPDFEVRSEVEVDSSLDMDLNMDLDLGAADPEAEAPAEKMPAEHLEEPMFEEPLDLSMEESVPGESAAESAVEPADEPAAEQAPMEEFSFDEDLNLPVDETPAEDAPVSASLAETPDDQFEIGGMSEPEPRVEPEDSYSTPKHLANGYANGSSHVETEERKAFPLLPVALGVAGLLLVLGLAFFLFMPRGAEPAKAPAAQEKPAAISTPAPQYPAPQPSPQPAAPAPAASATPPAPQPAAPAPTPATPAPKIAQPVPQKPPAPAPQKPAPAKPAPAKPPAAKPKAAPPAKAAPNGEPVGDVFYYTVKGDNLWNLAKSFYRNPWQFRKIAKENGINNPDFIREGQRIIIPEAQGKKR